jgi:hypothetical protein
MASKLTENKRAQLVDGIVPNKRQRTEEEAETKHPIKCKDCKKNKVMAESSFMGELSSCTKEATELMASLCAECAGVDDCDPAWNFCQECHSLGGGIDAGSKKMRTTKQTQCIHCESTLMCLECGNWPVMEAGEDCCKSCIDSNEY